MGDEYKAVENIMEGKSVSKTAELKYLGSTSEVDEDSYKELALEEDTGKMKQF